MPGRKIPLVTDEIYHILNRGVGLQTTFQSKRDYARAIKVLLYYQNRYQPFKYSRMLNFSRTERQKILEKQKEEKDFLVELIAYCLMPNHFHLVLKQISENGISQVISKFTNSYTRYFNTRNKRNGPLFQGRFKAIRVETDEQLWHLSRYTHLNPYTSYIVKTLKDLEEYPYSSFPEFIGKSNTNFCSKEIILGNFKDKRSYKKFVFNQADYQRKLEEIKHLTLEE